MLSRKLLFLGVSSALVVAATSFGVAQAGTSNGASAAEVAEMPVAVEDFNYPGAAKIQEETGAILKRGDGHLIMTACDGTEDILIRARPLVGQNEFCFDVTAKPAFLTLEIPEAYSIRPETDTVETTIKGRDSGTETVFDAVPNKTTGFGESGSTGEVSTLIELRVNS
ncbi:hypothetical protein [Streptomyces mesophilus]|uniref:hypothetical protein n=1 Tax=Streptomyces mesophilus TaxID=1775132 RepID=UPI003329B4F8